MKKIVSILTLIPLVSFSQKIDSLLVRHFSLSLTKAPPYFEYVEAMLDTATFYHYYDDINKIRVVKLINSYNSYFYSERKKQTFHVLRFAIGEYNYIDYGLEYLNKNRLVITVEKNKGYLIIFEKDFDCNFILDMIKNRITDLYITDTNKRVIYSSGWFDTLDYPLFRPDCPKVFAAFDTFGPTYYLKQIDTNKIFLNIMKIVVSGKSKKLYFKSADINWILLSLLISNVNYDSVKLFIKNNNFESFFIIYFKDAKTAYQEYKKVILNLYLSACNYCFIEAKSGLIVMLLNNKIYGIRASLMDYRLRKKVIELIKKYNINARLGPPPFTYIHDNLKLKERAYCPVPFSKYMKSK